MEDELKSKLVEILTSIQTAAGKASDFALGQLPEIAQSYVAYGRAYTTAIAILGLLLIGAGFWILAVIRRKVREADAQYAEDKKTNGGAYRGRYFEAGAVFPGPIVLFLVGGAIFAMNLGQLLLVWFAPKVWLLKEIAHLLK